MNPFRVALIGQPNVGKSRLAGTVSGAAFQVGNFAGVTVGKKSSLFEQDGQRIAVIDLPGLYSLNACTPAEEISKRFLLEGDYEIILNVIDASSLQRNLPLTLQLMDMGRKMVLAVNMMDEVESLGGTLDRDALERMLGIPVVAVSAATGQGVANLVAALVKTHHYGHSENRLVYDRTIEEALERLGEKLQADPELKPDARRLALRLLENDRDAYRLIHDKPVFIEFHDALLKEREDLGALMGQKSAAHALGAARVAIARGIVARVARPGHRRHTLSGRLDRVLIHPYWGLPIFFVLMWVLATFRIGEVTMTPIKAAFDHASLLAAALLPAGEIARSLSHGAIPAIGAVVTFLPNILILFLGLNLLEQTGYMARAAFLLDGSMKRFGLHGKSFIPLVTGFGCSVPAYMAAHTLQNPKDRLLTMLVIGFFSCSARLPVYVLFVGAFFAPAHAGNILFAIYAGGPLMAMAAAKVMRLTLLRGQAEPFVMDMPRYRLPSLKALLWDLKIKSLIFLRKAGLYIGVISVLVWFLSAYPVNVEQEVRYAQASAMADAPRKRHLKLELAALQLEGSYIGRFGQVIEPVFAPLGFDWKLSVAALSALAAKEAAVGTLNILYMIEEGREPTGNLIERVRRSVDFKTGIAFILIVMFHSPCIAAMSTFFSEVPVWKWRIFYLAYPNLLAWLVAFGAYRALDATGL